MATVSHICRDAYADNISAALGELRLMQSYQAVSNQRSCLRMAMRRVTLALGWANTMQDAALRSCCMRLLNWLRADLRRLV